MLIILIGMLHNFKTLKKIKLSVKNKFILSFDIDDITKKLVETNINKNIKKIINGKYNINNIDYNYIMNYLDKIYNIYINLGYIEKSYKDIEKILLLTKKNNKLWYSSIDNMKLNSSIKNKDMITVYHDPILAILSTFKFKDDEFKSEFINSKVKIQLKNSNCIKKLKSQRYIYMLENKDFVPIDNISSYTLSKPKIIAKEHIDNVYYKFKDIKLI